MSTIPLALAYGVARKKGIGLWALYLLIPLALSALFQWHSYRLYGVNLVSSAAEFARIQAFSQHQLSVPAMVVTALSYTGGCMASAICFAPLLWNRKSLVLWAAMAVAFAGLLLFMQGFLMPERAEEQVELSMLTVFLFGLFVVGGMQIAALAVLDLWKHRDAVSLLLFLWLVGTFIFSAFVNWTVNGRSLLPMAPVVGILVARRWVAMHAGTKESEALWRRFWPVVPAALIALWVTVGDYQLANASRKAVEKFAMTKGEYSGETYFQGHWGFQYYMEEEGVSPLDFAKTIVRDGDIVILPMNNSSVRGLAPHLTTRIRTIEVPVTAGVATGSPFLGAGFYSHVFGPLPFVVGPVPTQEFILYLIDRKGVAGQAW